MKLLLMAGWLHPKETCLSVETTYCVEIQVGFLSPNPNLGEDFNNHILEKHSLFNHKMEIDFCIEDYSKRNMTDSSNFLHCSTKTLWTLHLLPSYIFN